MSWQSVSNWLHGGRTLHLQQGPIDLLIRCEGEDAAVAQSYCIAEEAFTHVLSTLVSELPLLRQPQTNLSEPCGGAVARRMQAACIPYIEFTVTPMAAVAGAVADHVLDAMPSHPGLTRAWVNNGGDIALYLSPGQRFDCGVINSLKAGNLMGQFSLCATDGVGGVATSGQAMSAQGGRSFSLGIAESVTVLASTAAAADVAATVIANQVDLPGHPAIDRVPASLLDPDSDLGGREVTTHVGELQKGEVAQALEQGARCARTFMQSGHIHSALLTLRGQQCSIEQTDLLAEIA